MASGYYVYFGTKCPARFMEIGKSMPMNDILPKCSLVAVHDTKKTGLKFVHIDLKKFEGKFLIILFMDRFLTDLEIAEWKEFSSHDSKFREVNAAVIGVATASHPSIRNWMMNRMNGIKFPVIADASGEFSRTLGVLYRQSNCAARALAIISPEQKMIHLAVNNEYNVSHPGHIIEFIRRVKEKIQVDEASQQDISAAQTQVEEKKIRTEDTKVASEDKSNIDNSKANEKIEKSSSSNMKEEETSPVDIVETTEINVQTEPEEPIDKVDEAVKDKSEVSEKGSEKVESTKKRVQIFETKEDFEDTEDTVSKGIHDKTGLKSSETKENVDLDKHNSNTLEKNEDSGKIRQSSSDEKSTTSKTSRTSSISEESSKSLYSKSSKGSSSQSTTSFKSRQRKK